MSSGLLVLCRLLAVAAALAAASAEAGALRLRQQREKADKHYVVHVKNAQGKADVDEIAHRAQEVTSDYLGATLDRDAVALLEADGNIWSLEEDTPWEELGFRDEPATPEEEYYHRQLSEQVGHGIFDVQADQVEAGPANITVCVVDTGFAAGHPDLEGSSTTGVNRTSSEDGSIMPWNQDVRGHGTIVSGILAARISNDLGIRGIGDIPLFISRALNNNGRAFQSDIMGAMRDCQRHGAQIINLSLGGSYITSTMRSLISELYEDGILLVAAAGNDGTATAMYPAAHRDVISVSALTSSLDVWENSNYGPWIELTAPGYRINSTFPPDRYALYSGTSMAVPFVSGVAALVWSNFPQCSNSQIRFALAQTAFDLGTEGCDDNYGYGLVQAKTAYDFLLANPCQDADWGRKSHVGMCTTIPEPSEPPSMAPSLIPTESPSPTTSPSSGPTPSPQQFEAGLEVLTTPPSTPSAASAPSAGPSPKQPVPSRQRRRGPSSTPCRSAC